MMTRDIRYIDEGFLVWIIPSMYLSHEAVNWVCTTGVAVFAFIRFYFKFPMLWLLLLYYTAYIMLYHLCSIPPILCSYLIIPWVFSAWYCLLSLYLLLYVCAHDTIFNACLWFRFIDTRVLSLHAIWHSHHHSLGSSDSPGSSCPGLGVWSLWILPVADQSSTAEAWIIGKPSETLSFQSPLLDSRVFLM